MGHHEGLVHGAHGGGERHVHREPPDRLRPGARPGRDAVARVHDRRGAPQGAAGAPGDVPAGNDVQGHRGDQGGAHPCARAADGPCIPEREGRVAPVQGRGAAIMVPQQPAGRARYRGAWPVDLPAHCHHPVRRGPGRRGLAQRCNGGGQAEAAAGPSEGPLRRDRQGVAGDAQCRNPCSQRRRDHRAERAAARHRLHRRLPAAHCGGAGPRRVV
mmetsp:Transcript_60672/g.170970  ORF Transcript_60672/g.170970 Transcript_60672/m.170970 type:complete len:215 (-) Transcript_60672:273-917(-)